MLRTCFQNSPTQDSTDHHKNVHTYVNNVFNYGVIIFATTTWKSIDRLKIRNMIK